MSKEAKFSDPNEKWPIDAEQGWRVGHEAVAGVRESNQGEEIMEQSKPTFVVERLADGMGFGDGPISGQPEDVTQEELQQVGEAIQSPTILIPVDRDDNGQVIDDDGCGDGRGVKSVFTRLKDGTEKIFKRSLNRAKVFGGGLTMVLSARIGLGELKGISLQDGFESSIEVAEENGLNFGAHTADHVAPGREEIDSGCGAIDGAPTVLKKVAEFKLGIQEVITNNLGFTSIDDATTLETVFDNFADYDQEVKGQSFSGKKIADKIATLGHIVKELTGKHREVCIVLNMIQGYTVDQDYIRKISDGKAEVFAVDVWRLQEISQKLYPEDAQKQHQAFLSELVYTLGVAGVLTPGNLPVYVVKEAPSAVAESDLLAA